DHYTSLAKRVGIKVMLFQERQSISYFSEKLKEFYAHVRTLQTWKHYLLPKKFVIHRDHETLKHLRGQGKLSRRHTKWYKQGKMNKVADALSKRYALIAMLQAKMLGLDCIKELNEKDPDFGEPFAMSVHEAHEGGLINHFGELKTLEILNEHFY
ncbi:hypothetical protein CR513_41363, partial [Mucuna pruriens]